MRRSYWASKTIKVPRESVIKTKDGRKIIFKSKGIHNLTQKRK